MKLAVVLVVVVGTSAFAAPTDELNLKERTKKSPSISSYGGSYGASYGSPCAGAAPLAPIALYLAPQGAPHYREDEKADAHSEQARSYDGYGASAPAISLQPAALSEAIGYFPHGNIGPCGVPLLLSCSPNVVAGHLAGHSYSAPAYKQTEKEETTELKEAMENSWAEAQRDANNLGHHHHHHHHNHPHHHLDGLVLTGDHKAQDDHAHMHTSTV